ncbi:MAG: hypothetical protein HQK51_05215 [Oligoflexia bacterium]|nr:hypothetical protein [Oligoflexia bacterium]
MSSWKGICYTACGSSNRGEVFNDIKLLSELTNTIRTYSTDDCGKAEDTLDAAKSLGMKVYLGLWVGRNGLGNEMNNLIKLATARKLDNVEAVIVGCETQYRGDVSEEVLIQLINQVKNYLTSVGYRNILITTADTRNKWTPRLISAVDLVLSHMHPYWESTVVDNAIDSVVAYSYAMKSYLGNKPFILAETGWPDAGGNHGSAIANEEAQKTYYVKLKCAAKKHKMDTFYFEAFDSFFKYNSLEVEKHWGLFNSKRILKDHIRAAMNVKCPEDSVAIGTPTPIAEGPTPPTPPVSSNTECVYDADSQSVTVKNISKNVACVVHPQSAQKSDVDSATQRQLKFLHVNSKDTFVLLFSERGCQGPLIGNIRCVPIKSKLSKQY